MARYGMFDLGSGAADEVTVLDTVEKGIASFTYFYNVTDRKSVILTYEGEVEEVPGRSYPCLVETKGPDPEAFENGYVAYEDLPDEQKHLPGESSSSGWGKDAEASSDDDLDLGIGDDEEEEDEEDDIKSSFEEDGDEIYDGSEDMTL